MKCTKPPRDGQDVRPQREPVLIVLHADGWVECYGESHVDAHIIVAPYMESIEGEIKAQDYLAGAIPRRYRPLYLPGKCRAADQVRQIRPSDIARRDLELRALDSLDRLGDKKRRQHGRELRKTA